MRRPYSYQQYFVDKHFVLLTTRENHVGVLWKAVENFTAVVSGFAAGYAADIRHTKHTGPFHRFSRIHPRGFHRNKPWFFSPESSVLQGLQNYKHINTL